MKIKNKKIVYGILFGVALVVGYVMILFSEGSFIAYVPHK